MASAHQQHPGLPIAVSIEGEHLVISLAGEVDLSNAGVLTTAISAATSESDAAVLIDIAEVSFVDSAFLRTVVLCQQALARHGISVKVRNPNEQARRVFEITHLTELLA